MELACYIRIITYTQLKKAKKTKYIKDFPICFYEILSRHVTAMMTATGTDF